MIENSSEICFPSSLSQSESDLQDAPSLQRSYSDSVKYSPERLANSPSGMHLSSPQLRRTTTGSKSLSQAIRNGTQGALVSAAHAGRKSTSPNRTPTSPLVLSSKNSPNPSPARTMSPHNLTGVRQSVSPHMMRTGAESSSPLGPLKVPHPTSGRVSPQPVSPYQTKRVVSPQPYSLLTAMSPGFARALRPHLQPPRSQPFVETQPQADVLASPESVVSMDSKSMLSDLDDTWRDADGSPYAKKPDQAEIKPTEEDSENRPPETNRSGPPSQEIPSSPIKRFSLSRSVQRSPVSPVGRVKSPLPGVNNNDINADANASVSRSPVPPSYTPPRTTFDASKTLKSAADITAGAADAMSRSAVKKAAKCPASAKKRMSIMDSQSAADAPFGTVLRPTDKNRSKEGRPSLGTMLSQWRFMRSNFLKGDEDELEWLMAAKQPGAYTLAHRRFSDFEDQYYKCLCDIDRAERLAEVCKTHSGEMVACLKALEAISTTDGDRALIADEMLRTAQSQFSNILRKIEGAEHLFSESLWALCTNFISVTDDFVTAASSAARLQQQLQAERDACKTLLLDSQRVSESHLAEMEKWRKREKETADYEEAMNAVDAEWRVVEEDANKDALRIMRTYLPVGIADMTNEAFQERVQACKSGVYSFELLSEMKKNKFLHWLVMHPDDIAAANFLTGDGKQFFESLESYDVTELRALSLCVPEQFAVDSDGKKAEWRSRFMARVRLLVSQQKRERVKGGWDPVSNQRAMVELPPLKPEQLRRSVYFYRTKKECDLKLKQYDDRVNSLNKKKVLLATAEESVTEAKREYEAVVEEWRDPDLRAAYGVELLQSIREQAKATLAAAERKRNDLRKEVATMEKGVLAAPISREQYSTCVEAVTAYLATKQVDWITSTEPIPITGVFESEPALQRAERKDAKFASPEEEAAARKLEVTGLAKDTKTPVAHPAVEVCVEDATEHVELVCVSGSPVPRPEATEPEESTKLSPLRSSRGPAVFQKVDAIKVGFSEHLSKCIAGGSSAATSPVRNFSPKRAVSLPEPKSTAAVAEPAIKTRAPVDKQVLLSKTKSKLLKKLAAESESAGEKVPSPPRPAVILKPVNLLGDLTAQAGKLKSVKR